MSVAHQAAAGPWTALAVHPRIRSDECAARRHRAFARAHLGAAAVAGGCFIFYAAMSGPVGVIEALAGLWLISPAAIAFLPRLTGSLTTASAVSTINLTALISYLSLITGGLDSFLLVWLVVVPLEAAISGSRKLVIAAVLLCMLALAVMAGLEAAGLPSLLLAGPAASTLRSAVILLALIYAGSAALVLQRSQSDQAAAARRGEARYRLLAEHALDMISRHGPDGRLRFVSPACTSILGYAPEELEGRAAVSLIHPRDRSRVQTAFSRAIYFGENATLEYRHRCKNGGYVWLETRCRPVPVKADLPEEDPRMAGPRAPAYDLIAVTRDISRQKAQEAELREARDAAESANQAKSRFLAGMSHELRTPLNAILGFSEVMKEQMFGALGHPHYLDYARHIHESGEHLRDLIDGVLDLSKIEAGKYRLTPEAMDVGELVKSVLRTMSVTAEQAGVMLENAVDPGLPALNADRRAVRQMLLNLASNAVKFTPRGGRVAVAARLAGKAMVLEVRDSGIGIPRGELPRLAQPFEQAESVQRAREAREADFGPAPAGTGLGLAIVKSLAQLHGGALSIDSTPGRGTSVCITLPVCDVNEAGTTGEECPAEAADHDAA
ncbi:MAG: ATP-binding protein [bacterium]